MSIQKFDEATRGMSLERIVYADGMILTAEDFESERAYHLARSRMINRAVFGCGIACGLEVEPYLDGEETATRWVCIRRASMAPGGSASRLSADRSSSG